jgi:hypothetical protein
LPGQPDEEEAAEASVFEDASAAGLESLSFSLILSSAAALELLEADADACDGSSEARSGRALKGLLMGGARFTAYGFTTAAADVLESLMKRGRDYR